MSPEQEHALRWSDRLQDWLDGELSAADAEALQAHVTGCAQCQAQLRALEALDAALVSASPPLRLDERFDQKLFAKIDAVDDAQRAAARARVEQETRESLEALSRSWRRTLAFIAPGVLAGVALAFALSGWLFSAEVAQPLLENAENLTAASTDLIDAAITALLGASVGGVVARWLASAAE